MSLFLTTIKGEYKSEKDNELFEACAIVHAESIVDVSLIISNDLKRKFGKDVKIIKINIKVISK